MKVNFSKYHGTGNDFILIDNRNLEFPNDVSLIKNLCHRKFGIGADGLMLLQNKTGYDFEMVYFNSDGKESTMCGNGGRCIVRFAADLKIISKEANFLATDGSHLAFIENEFVRLQMKDVSHIENFGNDFVLNTGSPHYVKFVEKRDSIQVKEEGSKIRYSENFSWYGINVNFVEILEEKELSVLTYERGVEDETLSCGTGVVASCLAYYYSNFSMQKSSSLLYRVKVKGGGLAVYFDVGKNGFTKIFLKGNAKKVFEGEIEI